MMNGSEKQTTLLLLLLLTEAAKTGQDTPSFNQQTINNTEVPGHREAKLLSIFTVIRFPNEVCPSATTGRNGTCYTSSECSARSGSSSGSCASSFGVCCVFEASCGFGSISENNTYFTSSSITKGANCNFQICKSNSNVCQLRLDFETFDLNTPFTNAGGDAQNGAGANGAFTMGGTCHVDTFGISAPGHQSIPTICGKNTGEHMYVPASDQCNTLSANIGTTSTSSTGSFTIKITQIPCNSPILPRKGCLQYFYGSPSGTVRSYNYNPDSTGFTSQNGKSQLLANQHYNACIRTERGYCSICYWSPTDAIGFHMSVPNGVAAIGTLGWDTNCGALGTGTGVAIGGSGYTTGGNYDHITIPSGICHPPATAESTGNPTDRYCGYELQCQGAAGLNAALGQPDNTVCTNMKPFVISVHTDGVEYAHPLLTAEILAPNNAGFNLNYFMKTACLWQKTTVT